MTPHIANRPIDRLRWLLCFTMAVLLLPSGGSAQVENGDIVTFEYDMKDETGKQLDSSRGREPLTYEHGKGSLIPGLEKQLTGMRPGETKVIRVTPDEAHGPRMPQNIREVPRERLPEKNISAGDMFVFIGPEGQRSPVTVLYVKDKTVVLDFNNPLAGKTLVFDVRIVSVKKKDHGTTGPQDHNPD